MLDHYSMLKFGMGMTAQENIENQVNQLHIQLHHFIYFITDSETIWQAMKEKGIEDFSQIFEPELNYLLVDICIDIASKEADYWGKLADVNYNPELKDILQRIQREDDPEYAAELTGVNGSKRAQYAEARASTMISRFKIQPYEIIRLDRIPDTQCLYVTQITEPGTPAPHCLIGFPDELVVGNSVDMNSLWFLAFKELLNDPITRETLVEWVQVHEDYVEIKGALIRELSTLNIIRAKVLEIKSRYLKPKRRFIS